MTDMILWLRGVLDEDERAAKAAAEHCGCHEPTPRWIFADDQHEGRIMVLAQAHPLVRLQLSRRWNRSYPDLFTARHIARHDPASVLADIAAKRAIIDTFDVTEERSMPVEAWVLAKQAVQHLASAYSTRPGYREEWRP